MLLNELILSRLGSIPESMLTDKLYEVKCYVKQSSIDLSKEFRKNNGKDLSEDAKLEISILYTIAVNKKLVNPYLDRKNETLKKLLHTVGVKNRRIVV